ncbi:unnamed protein product [Pleuronectes platessa]|uniref:Uncharacterized protein n=1 Tax=Pleuronectes platessa TaxID=8262 RepID=A0A9N7W3J5_PLEPL|nr:unnamed protein product [Pleuronectes platessa]
MDETKALRDGPSSLKEQVEQLQEQLREKDDLLKKETREQSKIFRAYADCLYELTVSETKCGILEASLHQEPPQHEMSCSREVEMEKENQLLKEEVDLLKVGQRRLEDELMNKNQLIVSANEEKRAQTSAYIDCQALLSTKEQELKKTLTELGEIKALKDGTSSLKEQVEQLQEELREKDGLLKKETSKQRKSFKGFEDCLFELSECQAKCVRLEASLHQEPPQPEIDCQALLKTKEQELKKCLTELGEIKALNDGTSYLKEQVEQLHEELREKDGLLKKETSKQRKSFKGFEDCLFELSECQAKCVRLEASLHQEPPQPQMSCSREVEVEKENQLLKEEVDLLKVGQRRLEDELMNKNQLIVSANEEKRAQTSAYIDCQALLSTKDQELKKCLTELGEIKALNDGTASLKEQVEQLQEELREKDGLLKKETSKQRKSFKGFEDCLFELSECQAKCVRLEASLHQEPPQPEIDCHALLSTKEQELKKCLKELGEIKALNDGTSYLKEQVEQLHEELREKDGLLKKETSKKRKSFKGFEDCLFELSECQAKCVRLEASLHQEPPQPEMSCSREVEVEKENQLLKEEVDLLKVGQRRLEDELMNKNQLIVSANEEKRSQTSAYIDCQALLTTKEQELKKCLTEVGEIKALNDGTASLKEQVEQLQEELREKDDLLKKETREQSKIFRAYADCLDVLTESQAKCGRMEASLQQEPPQPETSWSRRWRWRWRRIAKL